MKRLRLFLANLGRRTPSYFLTTPPMGILYLAGYLRSKFDLEIRLLDQRAENCSIRELADQAIAFGADIVGFGSITTGAYMFPELTHRIREALPSALILLGGPHVSAFRAEAIEGTAADAAVPGEGELIFEQVIRARFDGGGLGQVPGLIWRSPDGQPITNPGSVPLIEDLDSLPFPAYDLIDVRKYWKLQSLAPIGSRRYISLLSSRGCPYQCMWCHEVFGKRFRRHSPERIVEEVDHCLRTWGPNEVEFLDDCFNLDADRVIRFCELAQKRNLRFKIGFPNALRTDILTQEVIDAMTDTGMYYSAFALETASPRLQHYTGKRLNIPRFLSGVEMAVKKGVFSNGLAMLGFPTETEAEIRQTIDVMTNSKLHVASFFTVTPFPKTRLYDEVMAKYPEKLAHIQYNDASYAGLRINCSDVPDAVFFGLQRKANLRFFLRPSRMYRILRDFPQRRALPKYLPSYLMRVTKGLFDRHSDR
jgi:anaerobic magnesium-protoporphyrin IX monomethyl ester cyclase